MRKTLLRICTSIFVLTLAGGTAVGQDILVWATGNEGANTQGVADYLDANGVFTSITVSEDPGLTLGDILDYDAVLFFTNTSAGADMVAIGDILADYADTGRRLVLATFCWANQGSNTLAGRIIDEEICPFRFEGPSVYSHVTMASHDGSGYFDGVLAVGGYFHDDVTVVAGAVQRATWNDGEPLLATKDNVVAVNLFPDDYYTSINGDYEMLFTNAVSFGLTAAEEAGWGTLKALY